MNQIVIPLLAQNKLGGTVVVIAVAVGAIIALFAAIAMVYSMLYRKAQRGQALVRTGVGGTKVSFNGMAVIPVLHRLETMDISLKRVEIDRTAKNGLICKDNMRADIKVAVSSG